MLSCIIHIGVQAQAGAANIYGASGSGAAGTTSVDWVLGSISADGIPVSAVLPVHFGAITASFNSNGLLVKWATETETNNDHFDIEVSEDGVYFKKIATIASTAPGGNSTTPLQYEYQSTQTEIALALGLALLCYAGLFSKRKKYRYLPALVLLLAVAAQSSCTKKDRELQTTRHHLYLRIAQVDKDGAKTYSRIIKVTEE
ncbi:hypothetical protein SAMN04487894_106210 [Niabella drilacis]|uniref:Uncharacterized protein n=2 Tax=Niabella drilacis (strain DSM 25811 / CCM 8410 / CCUG 62505 / LMG 26954 / E90) TaxID=1285928 RepID=A0A1G6SFF8_NIADE|nr:hypothetical protein SAMN04487894_106210 [Niabella drilacis]